MVESIKGADPNIAFTILKKTVDLIAREAVDRRKYICHSLVNMHEAVGHTSNPQTAIAITKQGSRSEPARRNRERIWLGFPIDESFDPAIDNDQERPVEVFTHTLIAGCRAGDSKELGRTRFPSPQPVIALDGALLII